EDGKKSAERFERQTRAIPLRVSPGRVQDGSAARHHLSGRGKYVPGELELRPSLFLPLGCMVREHPPQKVCGVCGRRGTPFAAESPANAVRVQPDGPYHHTDGTRKGASAEHRCNEANPR